MYQALEIGATGMRAQQTQIDTIAHNVANVNTAGFRRAVVSFAEVSAALAGNPSADLLQAARSQLLARNAGAMANVSMSSDVGEMKQTGVALDVAIDGTGFLEVVRADGTPAYTRAGALQVNAEGLLATADGSPLAARIAMPPDATAIRIAADGRVFAAVDDTAEMEVGQLELVSFSNLDGLLAAGDNQYVAAPQAGEARAGIPGTEGLGTIRQGYLESSNVQLIDELVSLMLAQRAFEMNSKIVQAADQMMAITNGLVR